MLQAIACFMLSSPYPTAYQTYGVPQKPHHEGTVVAVVKPILFLLMDEVVKWPSAESLLGKYCCGRRGGEGEDLSAWAMTAPPHNGIR